MQAQSGFRTNNATGTALAVLLLMAGIVMSLVLLPAPGTVDVPTFLYWGDETRRDGLVAGFAAMVGRFGQGPFASEYPPLGVAILDLDSTIAAALGAAPLIVFKLSLLAFALASAAAIAATTRRLGVATIFYGVTLLGTFGLGYTDVMTVPLLIVSLAATRAGGPVLAVGLLGVDGLIKWQVLLLLPFLLIHVLRIDGPARLIEALASRLFWRIVACGVVIAALATAWFGLATWMSLLNGLRHPFLSGNALNVPWIATFVIRLLQDASFGVGDEIHYLIRSPQEMLPFRAVFFGMFLLVLATAARAEKTYANLLFFMVLGVLTYGTWNTAVHENHWFVAVVPALLLAHETRSPAGTASAALVAVMLNINLFVFYGLTGTQIMPRNVGIDLSLVLSALFALAWLALFACAARLPRTEGRPGGSAP